MSPWIGTQVLRLRWPPWPQERVLGNGSPYNPQMSCSPKEGKRWEGKDDRPAKPYSLSAVTYPPRVAGRPQANYLISLATPPPRP